MSSTNQNISYLIINRNADCYIYHHKTMQIKKLVPDQDNDEDFLYSQYKDLAFRQISAITGELENMYCLLFGTTVWYCSSDLDDVLRKKMEFDSKYLYTVVYYPIT